MSHLTHGWIATDRDSRGRPVSKSSVLHLIEKAQQKQGTVEVGEADQPVQDDDETRRRKDPRSQYMAPTGAYTALKL